MERLTAPSGYKGPQPTVKPDLVGKLSRCGHIYHIYCLVAMYNNGNKVSARLWGCCHLPPWALGEQDWEGPVGVARGGGGGEDMGTLKGVPGQ